MSIHNQAARFWDERSVQARRRVTGREGDPETGRDCRTAAPGHPHWTSVAKREETPAGRSRWVTAADIEWSIERADTPQRQATGPAPRTATFVDHLLVNDRAEADPEGRR